MTRTLRDALLMLRFYAAYSVSLLVCSNNFIMIPVLAFSNSSAN